MNRTVERTLAILKIIANSEHGITLQEIANQMDMAKSSTFAIVHTLLELNYISTVENNAWGSRLLRSGLSMLTIKASFSSVLFISLRWLKNTTRLPFLAY